MVGGNFWEGRGATWNDARKGFSRDDAEVKTCFQGIYHLSVCVCVFDSAGVYVVGDTERGERESESFPEQTTSTA